MSNHPTYTVLSDEEIEREHAALLAKTGLTRDELSKRAALYSLTPEQDALRRDIEDLEFLLTSGEVSV